MTTLICLVIAYLIGSLSTSLLLSKLLKTADPRLSGSGNAGATNVLRQLGKRQALVVLIGDALKGLIAVWLAHAGGLSPFMVAVAGLVAIVGHVFPVYFKFKGGKGVATALGVSLCLSFSATIVLLVVFGLVIALTRYVSLASLIAAALLPFAVGILGHGAYFIPGLGIAALIIWRHKANLDRLRAGTESKVNFQTQVKKTAPAPKQPVQAEKKEEAAVAKPVEPAAPKADEEKT